MQTAAAILIALALVAFVARLHVGGRAEAARRAAMSPEERQRLEHENAVWSQRYGF